MGSVCSTADEVAIPVIISPPLRTAPASRAEPSESKIGDARVLDEDESSEHPNKHGEQSKSRGISNSNFFRAESSQFRPQGDGSTRDLNHANSAHVVSFSTTISMAALPSISNMNLTPEDVRVSSSANSNLNVAASAAYFVQLPGTFPPSPSALRNLSITDVGKRLPTFDRGKSDTLSVQPTASMIAIASRGKSVSGSSALLKVKPVRRQVFKYVLFIILNIEPCFFNRFVLFISTQVSTSPEIVETGKTVVYFSFCV